MAGLCVGYPAEQSALSRRLPATLVVHRDRYDDSALPEALAAYNAARPFVAATKQKNPQTYPPEAQCTWSRNVARQLSVPERADFGAVLRQRGIALE